MAALFLEPTGTLFPGGIAGGYGVSDTLTRFTAQPPFPTGQKARDANGNEWTVAKAGATIAAFDALTFGGLTTGLGWDDLRPTSAAQQIFVGSAPAGITSGQWGWVQTKGVMTTKVVVATAAGSLLVSGGTAGQLQLAAATDFAGASSAEALVTGVAAGSAIFKG